jgi:phenylacetate-coenzyme A ligase PaaK-like adenylate-forming protein
MPPRLLTPRGSSIPVAQIVAQSVTARQRRHAVMTAARAPSLNADAHDRRTTMSRQDHVYEETRRRHIAYMSELLPHYLARLGWSRAEIDAEQTRALRELLRHAVGRSPWHRERLRHVDVERITPARLTEIPPMTKDDLMAHWDAIVTDPRCTLAAAEAHLARLSEMKSDAYFLDDYHVIASGGSSGRRGVFAYDWHGWAACHLGLLRGIFAIARRAPAAPAGPIASVSAYAATHASSALIQTFSDPDRPFVRAPVTLPLAEIVAILNRAQPSVLHCYASMLPVLAEEARAGRLRIAPALVWSTSEPLLPELRAAAEAAWGAPVLNTWAASESNGGAFSCPVGPGFHIGEDLNVIEPVDEAGHPTPPGRRSAKILLTNLYNRLMPLIRYEITDEFQVAAEPCRCGAAYLKVEDVHGRADDIFEYGDDPRVHPLNFRAVLGKEPSIVAYQVRQTERGAAVTIVSGSAIDGEALGRALAERLASLGVRDPIVTVEQRDAIERQAIGKLKRFVPLPKVTAAGVGR